MKKVLKVLTAAMLAAVVAASAATTCAFAAEENKLNEYENKVLTKLKGETVNMGGIQKPLKAQWLTEAEKCFNEIDMTEAQSKDVIAKIDELKKYLEGLNRKSIDELEGSEYETALSKAKDIAKLVGVTLTFNKVSKEVSYVVDKPNQSSVKVDPGTGVIKTTGLDVPGVAPVAGVAVLAVAAAGIYVIAASKKKDTVGA